uniref:Uncharacterized protein n=1 Tax=Globodera rostochiensis TaxID=31243 RepID=A0A914H4S5_GLORO
MLLNLLAVYAVALMTTLYMPVQSAYTYQKMDELMPELRQYLGRTHLGTLKARQFNDDDNAFQMFTKRTAEQQIRERKSNNLRNLMRIGKRNVPFVDNFAREDEVGVGAIGPVYYLPSDFLQAYRPQSVWLRR